MQQSPNHTVGPNSRASERARSFTFDWSVQNLNSIQLAPDHVTHKGGHDYIDHVTRILKESAFHQNDLTYAYVIRNDHRTVIVSTLINETLARFWSAPTCFRRSARFVRKINFDTILISIDQRIYWWKINTALINIDWLINFYTSQYSVFALRSTFIKSISWHDFHKNIDQVENFFPCIAALSAKSTFRLSVYKPVRLPASFHINQILSCNLSLHTLQSASNFWRPVCLSACLRHISQNLATTSVVETARKTLNLRRKFENPSMHLTVSTSDTAFLAPQIRQCIWQSQRQVQHFWQTRKPASASNRLSVECSISGTANLPARPPVSALDAALWQPHQIIKQHLDQHVKQHLISISISTSISISINVLHQQT